MSLKILIFLLRRWAVSILYLLRKKGMNSLREVRIKMNKKNKMEIK